MSTSPTPAPADAVRWVKARDTMLSGSGRGSPLPDGEVVDSEAALVLTVGDQTVVIEGSYRRLLKWLEYGRDRLLAAAPALQHVSEGEGHSYRAGLRCPHCGAVTWHGDEKGIRVVDYGERWSSLGYRVRAGRPEIVGSYADRPEMETDRYECESCERPVTLPDDVVESGR